MERQIGSLVHNFLEAARFSGFPLSASDITSEVLPAPHQRPASLPVGKKAVYAFVIGEVCLKVGKAGPKSAARFTSQHYNPHSSRSNLAKSILHRSSELKVRTPQETDAELTEATVGCWLETNTTRYHFFIDEQRPECLLSLLEAFMQCRLRPVFEGKGK